MNKVISGRSKHYYRSEYDETFAYRYDKINMYNEHKFRWFGDIYKFDLYSTFPGGVNSRLYNWLAFPHQKLNR